MRLLLPFTLALIVFATAPAAQEAPRLAAPVAFPNPLGQGPLTIRYADDGRAEAPAVEVFDVLGRRASAGGALPAGTYLYRLRYADGRVSPAARLVKLTGGPLDVRLVPSAAAASSVAPAAPSVSAAGCDDGLLWRGVRHAPLGVAEVETAIPAILTISNIGDSGQDGVRTCLGNTAGTELTFGAFDLAARPGQRFVWDLDRDGLPGNGVLARATFEEAEGNVEAAVDFSGMGATSLVLEGYDGPDLVCISSTPGAQRTFSLAPMDGGVVLRKAGASVVFQDTEAPAGAGPDPERSLLLHYEMNFSWGVSRDLLCNGLPVGVDHIRVRTDLRPAGPANAVVRESRMRFKEADDVVTEDIVFFTMGHALAAWRDLVALGDASELVAAGPLGPLSVTCAQGGCVRGLEILAPPGRDRLRADFQPFRIRAGSSDAVELFYEYDAVERAGAPRTLAPPLKLTLEGRPGGIILRMDKDICDEGAGPDECRITFEYVRNGVVRVRRAVRSGTAVPVNRSLTVRSVEVSMDDAPGGPEKPPSWTISLGVSLLGGNETLRISGQGETAAALHGYGVVWGLLDQPFKVTDVWSCPGDAACPPEPHPAPPFVPDSEALLLFGAPAE